MQNKTSFLVKPRYEGKSYRCFESGFHATCEDSVRVNRLEDMRIGLIDHTPEEFTDLKGKQPLFYLQERFASDRPGFEWNGLLLYGIRGHKDDARKVTLAQAENLHIVMAFDDPDSDFYFILIDTETGGGTHDDFLLWQQDIRDMVLSPFFHKPHPFPVEFYTRALTIDHYDIVDYETLFHGENDQDADDDDDSNITPPASESRTCKTMSIGEILDSFFGHIFRPMPKFA